MLAPVDGDGNAVGLDATPTVTSDNVAVATGWADPFGRYWVTAAGVGTCKITVSAASSGVPLSESFSVTVSPDAAVTLGLTFLPPVAK